MVAVAREILPRQMQCPVALIDMPVDRVFGVTTFEPG